MLSVRFRGFPFLFLLVASVVTVTSCGREAIVYGQDDSESVRAEFQKRLREDRRLLESHVATIDRNVIYGMYSGLALLMDVYHPHKSNGYAIVQISGSGFTRQLRYDARPLNRNPHVANEAYPLLDAGYTVFSLNHRAAPRFQFPDQVADVQRAVRFIRFHADEYGIKPEKIGAIGGSSGGHLVSMLGVLNGDENRPDNDPVNMENAKVQCVIAAEAPSDFLADDGGEHFLGVRFKERRIPGTQEHEIAVKASPVTYISKDDPPILLVHGEEDEGVPFRLSQLFHERLVKASVTTRLIPVPGAGHGFQFFDKRPKDLNQTYVDWMNLHLRGLTTN